MSPEERPCCKRRSEGNRWKKWDLSSNVWNLLHPFFLAGQHMTAFTPPTTQCTLWDLSGALQKQAAGIAVLLGKHWAAHTVCRHPGPTGCLHLCEEWWQLLSAFSLCFRIHTGLSTTACTRGSHSMSVDAQNRSAGRTWMSLQAVVTLHCVWFKKEKSRKDLESWDRGPAPVWQRYHVQLQPQLCNRL